MNTAFLTMAIQEGLTMAIANPSQELLVNMVFASDLLMNKEEADVRYIERMASYKERAAALAAKQQSLMAGTVTAAKKEESGKGISNQDLLSMHQIYQDVMKGNRKQIREHTQKAVEEGQEASYILNELLLPAINEVGDLFDKGKYFLPQLIASAESMKLAIEYLEPLLITGEQTGEMPVVVIATVEGDIHDIGKNLVALMLKNYGFQVIDLGKDVTKETIVEAAAEHHAKIIALSALMTTTMLEMKKVVDYARECNIDAKIMIGGAVITQEFAEEIGADGYSRDAAEAVKVAKKLLGMEE